MSYDTVTNLFDLWKESNGVTDSYFSYFFLLVVFIIAYFVLSNFDTKNTLLASSFLTAVVGFLMYVGTLIGFVAFITTLIVLAASILWVQLSDSNT